MSAGVCGVQVWPGGDGLPTRECGHPIEGSHVISDGGWPTPVEGEPFCNDCAPPLLPDDLVAAGALNSYEEFERLVLIPAQHAPQEARP